jgi:hypothetical protein
MGGAAVNGDGCAQSLRLVTDSCRCAAFGGLPFGTCLRSGAGSLALTGFLAAARRQPFHVIGHLLQRTKATGGPVKFQAENRIDYMHFACDKCQGRIRTTFLGYDPAIPRFRFECLKCGESGEFKMEFPLWQGLPQQPAD